MALCPWPLDLLLLEGREDATTLVMGMAGPHDLETMAWPEQWASPGGWLGSAASWEEARHCFRACVGPAGTQHSAGSTGCQVWPTSNQEFVYCFNDPW